MGLNDLWTVILGAIAILWAIQWARLVRGMGKVPRLAEAPPLSDADCPRVSVLFAARDEAQQLPSALATHLALDGTARGRRQFARRRELPASSDESLLSKVATTD